MQPRSADLCNEKLKFLRQAYDFPGLAWEKKARGGQQLVSDLLSKSEAKHFLQLILQIETEANHASLRIVASHGDQTKYRILVDLNTFDLDAAKKHLQHKQATIIDFLNKVHHPTWKVDGMKLSNAKWEIHHDEICFFGPSCGYYPDLEVGIAVSDWLFNVFDKQATEAGFSDEVIEKFKHNLNKEDHKHSRVHFFKNNHFVYGELFLLAQIYCASKLARQTQAFAQVVATAALPESGLPPEICNHIGFFTQPAEAANLAQVNKKSAKAAKTFAVNYHQEAVQQLTQFKRL